MVRLILYNIEYDEGIIGRWYDYLMFWRVFFPPPKTEKGVVEFLKKQRPDILALVEVDTGSIRNLYKDEARIIERDLGLHSIAEAVKYPKYGLAGTLRLVPILNKQANALLSKYPLKNVKYHVLSEGVKRVVIEGTAECPKKITFLVAHLALRGKTRRQQIKELTEIVRKIGNDVILVGDFNTFHGYKEVEHLLHSTHLHAAYKIAHKKELTFPAWHPTRRLDWVLYSRGIRIEHFGAIKVPYSDHLPIVVDFTFRKQSQQHRRS